MKRKVFMYAGIIFLILTIISIGYLVYINHNSENVIIEYIPEQEITDEQLRQTIVTLYFKNIDTGNLMAEPRQIDAKELVENPYSKIINLLIEGPKNETLSKLIPSETVVNNVNLQGSCLNIDFSKELIQDEEANALIIKSIVNTLTELVEIDSVKLTIDDEDIFNRIFTREF